MSKKRVSLEMQLAGHAPEPAADHSTDEAVPLPTAPGKPAQEKATVYMSRPALKLIKQMALDQDKRLNDLLQEGVNLMLARYGQPSLQEIEQK